MTLQAAMLPDGRRLHLQHGPIDLIVEAFGARDDVKRAYAQAIDAFGDVLPQLVRELPVLRTALGEMPPVVDGPVAQRMVTACWPYRQDFITPMAAVAGSVADYVLQRMVRGVVVRRAYVNDGGDIAICLAPGQTLTCGVAHDLAAPAVGGTIALTADLPVRGVATSGRACKGRGGRSFSFGIADAVTVLAADAAAADAAATVIANAVDLPGHAAVTRVPACEIDPDSDLGGRLVTFDLAELAPSDIGDALHAGIVKAESLRQAGHIYGAMLVLRRHFATVGPTLTRLAA